MNINITKGNNFFKNDFVPEMVQLSDEIYIERMNILIDKINEKGLTHVVIYADRENFSTMEYFTKFEPRFEEAIFIVTNKGEKYVLAGNENYGYADIIPFNVTKILYQNLSLQGQPREKLKPLSDIYAECGINKNSKVGLLGHKYFYEEYDENSLHTYDVPMYICNHLFKVAGEENVINFLNEITGMPNGIRMEIRHPEEVAWAEYNACKTASVILRLLKGLKEGVTELELSRNAKVDFTPISMFPLTNFGQEHGAVGLRSPNEKKMEVGDFCGLCYGVRGALSSRVGVSAYDENSMGEYKNHIEDFYKPFWQAIATWYESIHINANCGQIYKNVMDIIGDEKFGVTLNPGHYIGMDEWTNTPIFKDSKIKFEKSAYLQSDIIVSANNPTRTAICEDGIIIATKELRDKVKKEYPQMWNRIQTRKAMMKEYLGINLSEDALPLNNINGVFFPFMLDLDTVFSK